MPAIPISHAIREIDVFGVRWCASGGRPRQRGGFFHAAREFSARATAGAGARYAVLQTDRADPAHAGSGMHLALFRVVWIEAPMKIGVVRALGAIAIVHAFSHAILPLRGSFAPAFLIDDWVPILGFLLSRSVARVCPVGP